MLFRTYFLPNLVLHTYVCVSIVEKKRDYSLKYFLIYLRAPRLYYSYLHVVKISVAYTVHMMLHLQDVCVCILMKLLVSGSLYMLEQRMGVCGNNLGNIQFRLRKTLS